MEQRDWCGFLEVARELSERGDDGAQRSAISRAYYALHNRARDWAERHTTLRAGDHENTHAKLAGWLSGEGPDGRLLSVTLKALREARNVADYEEEPHQALGRRGRM